MVGEQVEPKNWCMCCGRHISSLKPMESGRKLARMTRPRIPHLTDTDLEKRFPSQEERDGYKIRSILLCESFECSTCMMLNNKEYFDSKGKGQCKMGDFL